LDTAREAAATASLGSLARASTPSWGRTFSLYLI